MTWETKIPKFRRFVLQNFPFIEKDFDALTDYQLISKVVEYLNKVINSQNELVTEVESFETNITTDFTRLEGLFTELKSYVDNYFDNLDVQEEINNKLDAMVEAGTLQEIITEYINATALWMFDNVADMKLATNFVNGSYAKTLGFYSKNDKGGAIYKIRSKTVDDVADEMTLIELYDNTLVAELVKTVTMNVRQFGAKGDSSNDDTLAIQTALNYTTNIIVPTGTYMVDAETQLLPNTGNTIEIDKNAILKAITNDADRYAIFMIDSVNNIEISGGTIEGERQTHTGATGEWGYGIQVKGTATNIYLHDIYIKDCWGDGLCVSTTGDVKSSRLHIDNARRNGISVIQANSYISTDDFIENTNGTDPQCAVDIEPDLATEKLNYVEFNNLHTKNNTNNGLQTWLQFVNTGLNDHIVINNMLSENDKSGIWIESFAGHIGSCEINNAVIKNTTHRGLYLRNRGLKFQTTVNRPIIDGYGIASANSHGIDIEGYNFGESSEMGNIKILEPTVINGNISSTNPVAIQFVSISNTVYKNIYILNPLNTDNKFINFNVETDNVKVTDGYEVMKRDTDAETVVGANEVPFITATLSNTALRQIRISGTSKFPVGVKLKFLNNGNNGIKIYFQNQYIYGITNDVNKSITSTDKGAYLEIMRISGTEWTVIDKSGTWTSN